MDVSNLIEVKGIRSEGYGIVAKAPMRDKRLTAEAKAIYAYLCSYTGAGSCAFPPLALMLEELGMAPKRYYKHLRHLTAYGYVKVHTRYKAAGKSRETNVYEIVDMPEVDVAELAKLARAKATDGEAPEAPGDATEGMGPGAGSIVENSQNPRSADIGHFDQHQIVENSDDRQNPRSVDIGRFEQVQIEQVQNDQTIINNPYKSRQSTGRRGQKKALNWRNAWQRARSRRAGLTRPLPIRKNGPRQVADMRRALSRGPSYPGWHRRWSVRCRLSINP